MDPVLHPIQMRAADERTIAAGTPGIELMDRAGWACATVALRMLGGAYGRRVAVVCGKGNNGGDGLASARHLAAAGVVSSVTLVDEPAGDAAHHLRLARGAGVRFEASTHRADLVVDAVLGTGFAGEPRGAVGEALAALAVSDAPVLSIDIPSGVSGADGTVPGPAPRAAVTVAVQALKPGHVLAPGAFRCGRIDVADVGIAVDPADTFVPSASDVLDRLPHREPEAHKYRVGALAVLGGSSGMSGAIALTGSAAVRAGAGLVVMGVPNCVLPQVEAAVTEAVKVGLPELDGQLDPKAVDEFAEHLDRVRAIAVGPGLGRSPRTVDVVRRVLDRPAPIVIDADGLWALGRILDDEPDVLRRRGHPTVLTPHTGEFRFLTRDEAGVDRIVAARAAADRLGAIVHLKGRRALTASPGGAVWVNPTGTPHLATGGTGDVLTGIIGSFLAQGCEAADATWMAAYLHGVAGELAGPGLAAGDLPDRIPAARRRVAALVRPTGRIRTVLRP